MTGESSDSADRRQVEQARYDPESDRELATVVVFAIADAKGVDPLDGTMPPLYDTIDAEALEDTFFGSTAPNTDREELGVVSFHYDGYRVVVRSDGSIRVTESR
ncbi:HalOD1 output domain-containing protein [Halorussus amylolyticus]|uniref:HalOD1 output domain-containing protein n=1 Tax=Halorussus amylolyticus TaxID=1126242 RepID=UPI00138EEA58|nr:HalOD1 output domain-containing protein [Halorussus amylolyticus]